MPYVQYVLLNSLKEIKVYCPSVFEKHYGLLLLTFKWLHRKCFCIISPSHSMNYLTYCLPKPQFHYVTICIIHALNIITLISHLLVVLKWHKLANTYYWDVPVSILLVRPLFQVCGLGMLTSNNLCTKCSCMLTIMY